MAGNFAAGFTGQVVSTIVLTWNFTLSANQIVEGGASVMVTATITNENYTPPIDVPIALQWGGTDIGGTSAPGNLLMGAGSATTMTIPASATDLSVSLEITAPDDDLFTPTLTAALIGTHGGKEIGRKDLEFVNDDANPTVKLATSSAKLNEGGTITLTATVSVAASLEQSVALTTTGNATALTGTIPSAIVIPEGVKEASVTVATDDNTVQNDGARDVTFTLELNADAPYTLGDPSAVTVTVLDNDTPPSAPRNLMAAPGDQQVTPHVGGAGAYPRPRDHEVPVPPQREHRRHVRGLDRRPGERRGHDRIPRDRAHQRHGLPLRGAREE